MIDQNKYIFEKLEFSTKRSKKNNNWFFFIKLVVFIFTKKSFTFFTKFGLKNWFKKRNNRFLKTNNQYLIWI